MRSHTFTRPLWAFRCKMLALAKLALNIGVADDAAGNNKLIAAELEEFKDWIAGYIKCFNHQNMLGHLDLASAIFKSAFIHSLHSSCSF